MPGIYQCQLRSLDRSLNSGGLAEDICGCVNRIVTASQRALIFARECEVETCFVLGSTS